MSHGGKRIHLAEKRSVLGSASLGVNCAYGSIQQNGRNVVKGNENRTDVLKLSYRGAGISDFKCLNIGAEATNVCILGRLGVNEECHCDVTAFTEIVLGTAAPSKGCTITLGQIVRRKLFVYVSLCGSSDSRRITCAQFACVNHKTCKKRTGHLLLVGSRLVRRARICGCSIGKCCSIIAICAIQRIESVCNSALHIDNGIICVSVRITVAYAAGKSNGRNIRYLHLACHVLAPGHTQTGDLNILVRILSEDILKCKKVVELVVECVILCGCHQSRRSALRLVRRKLAVKRTCRNHNDLLLILVEVCAVSVTVGQIILAAFQIGGAVGCDLHPNVIFTAAKAHVIINIRKAGCFPSARSIALYDARGAAIGLPTVSYGDLVVAGGNCQSKHANKCKNDGKTQKNLFHILFSFSCEFDLVVNKQLYV